MIQASRAVAPGVPTLRGTPAQPPPRLRAALGRAGVPPAQQPRELGHLPRPGSSAARNVPELRSLDLGGPKDRSAPAARTGRAPRAEGPRAAGRTQRRGGLAAPPPAQAQQEGGRALPTAGGGRRGRPRPRQRCGPGGRAGLGAGRLRAHRSARLRASAECPPPHPQPSSAAAAARCSQLPARRLRPLLQGPPTHWPHPQAEAPPLLQAPPHPRRPRPRPTCPDFLPAPPFTFSPGFFTLRSLLQAPQLPTVYLLQIFIRLLFNPLPSGFPPSTSALR